MDPQTPPPPPPPPPPGAPGSGPAVQPAPWAQATPPPAMPWTPQPAPARRRRNFLALIVLVIIVALIGGALYLFRDRLTGGVGELQVGDCIDIPTNDTSVTDVQHQPCTAPHDAEVFLNYTDTTTGTYPGADHFKTLATTQCLPAASAYIGADFNSRADLDAGYFYPTESSWTDHNDRGLTCYLYRVDHAKLSAPLHNAGPSQ